MYGKSFRQFLLIMVKELKATFPVVFEISEDFYKKVIISTLEDILVLAEKFIAFPIVGMYFCISIASLTFKLNEMNLSY